MLAVRINDAIEGGVRTEHDVPRSDEKDVEVIGAGEMRCPAMREISVNTESSRVWKVGTVQDRFSGPQTGMAGQNKSPATRIARALGSNHFEQQGSRRDRILNLSIGISLDGSIEGRREDISDCLLSRMEGRRLPMTGESRMAAEGRREAMLVAVRGV